MINEWLRFRVNPELREKFIQLDQEIWDGAIATAPGYLGKEVWLGESPDEVVVIVHWESYPLWKSVPQDLVDATEAEFSAQMGAENYQLLEGRGYSIRKLPHN
ncbi:MAG: TIGR03792 family protein [Spirulina sp. DLM2.Bin59]|nr:MAG: TIGR03792 family protein [Spirulina sp. DLM2.Bin59]